MKGGDGFDVEDEYARFRRRQRIHRMHLVWYAVSATLVLIGMLTNPSKMANTLSTEQGVKPDVHTVQQYLKFLTQAYLFSKAARYDVKGRRYMQYPSKWYAEDVGLRNARLNYRQSEKTHLSRSTPTPFPYTSKIRTPRTCVFRYGFPAG